MNRPYIQETILSISLALILIWFGANEIYQPDLWISYIPSFIDVSSLAETVIAIHGAVLIISALLIMLNYGRSFGAIIVAILLTEIVINMIVAHGLDSATIINIGILGMAIALIFSNGRRSSSRLTTAGAPGIFPDKYR